MPVRPYETVIVYDGTLPDDVLGKERQNIETFLQENGTFENTNIWGKMPLAYPIKKKKSGYYCIFNYLAEGNMASSLEKHLKLNEKVLRLMTVLRNVKNDEARAALSGKNEKATVSSANEESEE